MQKLNKLLDNVRVLFEERELSDKHKNIEFDNILKVERTIESCTNLPQLDSARNLVSIIDRRYNNYIITSLLNHKLNIKQTNLV